MDRLSFQESRLSFVVFAVVLVCATFVLCGCANAFNSALSYGDNKTSDDGNGDDASNGSDDKTVPLPKVRFYNGKRFNVDGITYISISLYNSTDYLIDSPCVVLSTASPYVSNLINGDLKSNSAYFDEIWGKCYKTYKQRCVSNPNNLDYGDYKTAPFSLKISNNCPVGQKIYFNVRIYDFHSNVWMQENAFYIEN